MQSDQVPTSGDHSAGLTRRRLLGLGAAGAAALATGVTAGARQARAADGAIAVDPATRYQTMEGWGTALSWGANVIGGWHDVDKRTEIVDLLFGAGGLGIDIARYNIGATENPTHHHMRLGASIPSFWPEQPGTWDYTRDAGQRWVLAQALARETSRTEAFVCSPHYWWTRSGCVSGAADKGDNLLPEHVDDFADYVTDVALLFARRWGTRFGSLSPINEPIADWWVANGTQEGCHYSLPMQARVLDAMRRKMDAKGLSRHTRLAMPEEPGASAALDSITSYGDDARLLGQVNTHSYWNQERTGLRDAVRALPAKLWMSEFGTAGDAGYQPQDISNALNLSKTMLVDLNVLQAQAWNIWNAIESIEANRDGNTCWGIIHATYTPGQEEFYVAKQYYGYGNYVKYVHPGATVIRVGDANAFAAYDARRRELVVVYTEPGTADRDVTFDLGAFAPSSGPVLRRRTSSTENLAALPAEARQGGTYRTTLKGQSITTFVLPGVVPTTG